MNGNDIIIKLNGTAIASCKSQEVTTQADTIEIASSTQQTWKEYITERKDWSINTNYLVTTVSDIEKVLLVGTVVTIVVVDRANGATLSGSAIVKQCKQTYARGAVANGSFQFQGSGALI